MKSTGSPLGFWAQGERNNPRGGCVERQQEGRRESGQPGERLAAGTPPRSAGRGGPVLAAPPPTSSSSRGPCPIPASMGLVTSRRSPVSLVTSRSGPRVFSRSARGSSGPWRARGGGPMKKVTSKHSPPRLFGGCASPRGALVAMDAAATAGGRARAGARGPATRPSYPRSPRSRTTLSARAVP